MRYLEDIQGKIAILEVYECDCGFHIGLDASYTDQVGDITIQCPSCGATIDTGKLFPGEED